VRNLFKNQNPEKKWVSRQPEGKTKPEAGWGKKRRMEKKKGKCSKKFEGGKKGTFV